VNTYLAVYFGSLLVAMLLVPIVSRLAKRYHFVDQPDPRKVHKVPVPRVGGIAFVVATLALVVPVFFLDNTIGESFRQSRRQFIALLTGACFMFAVGLIDDLHPMRGFIKLLCLVAAALCICASGATIHSFSVGSWFTVYTGWAAWPLTVCWIVGIAVCMSLVDGLDGLAAGIAAMVSGTLVLLALWSGQAAMVVLMLALLGGVTGFLFFNFYPAKIFMGDCGSLFLGFMIGAGSIVCESKTSTFVALALPFLVLGVPILDTGLVITFRGVVKRRSLFTPDNNHFHYRLLRLGLHHRAAVIVIYAITAISASLGVFMLRADGQWSMGLLVGAIALLCTMFACLHRGRYYRLFKGLKRNLAVARQAKAQKRSFENAQVQMSDSRSFHAWWQTLCTMGEQMHFRSLGLSERENGQYVNTCGWNAPQKDSRDGRTVKFSVPLQSNGGPECELRACICVDDYLELSARQAMLLSRLVDEFPLPQRRQDTQPDGRTSDAKLRSTTKGGTGPSGLAAAPVTHILERPAYLPEPVEVMGIPVAPFESYDQALDCVEKLIEADAKSLWVAINPIKMYHAWQKPQLRELLRQADVGICDGVGVSIASKLLRGRSIARCTGCDLFFRLVERASGKGWGVYLLGASAEVNAAARAELQRKYPGLKIVGWHDGYFKDSQAVIEEINLSKANILLVAMGSPKQEEWIRNHWQVINTNICMGVGGSFDIAAGRLKRAPRIFRMTGTEFLYRLISEPRKRWSIQKVLIPYFLQVMGKKAVDLTLSEESTEEPVKP
jgi:exopolysaccharide biosynthesis WecB/TagA/CpsF family protein